jgi:restriction system protein
MRVDICESAGVTLAREETPPPPRVWVVRAGKGGRHAADFERLGIIAVGFAEAGDVSGLEREELFEQVRAAVGSRAGNIAGQMDRFARVMVPGDLVAVPDGGTRELLCGEITGPYEYRSEPPVAHFRNVRRVSWLGRRDRDLLPDRILYTLGSLLTVYLPGHQDLLRGFLQHGTVDGGEGEETNGPDDTELPFEQNTAADQEARNAELVAKRIAALGPYETQDLAAGVLHALGYETEVAPPGADGGIDIRACRDPLFLHPPVLKVQVKARPGTKTSPDEIRQLNGLLDRNHERGVFLATGGFTGPAAAEADRMQIQTWDLERLVELYLDTYDRLDSAVADLVPLRQIWVLDSAPHP